jgi:gamma-glutamylcyclotransferase (GGCT)/AIG2-like uncharacterized protein YtfP
MKKKTKLYGAYGSNMNIEQMKGRCPGAILKSTGFIHGYRLTFRGSGVANIETARGRKVPIVLWEITPECEAALDRYEGFPSFYVKRKVKVKTMGGDMVEAFVYVMAERYETRPCPPGQYYFNVIQRGYRDNTLPLRFLREAVAENQRECDEARPPRFDWRKAVFPNDR